MLRALTRIASPHEAKPHPVPAPATDSQVVAEPSSGRSQIIPFARSVRIAAATTATKRVSIRAFAFFVVVLLPTILAGLYYFAIAADQYVAEFRFSLRTAERPRTEAISLLDGNVQPPAILESQIVAQYIASRAMIEEVEKSVPLRPLFSPPEADFLAGFDRSASIEMLVEFWRKQVDAFYDPSTGTTTVRVRAFTPPDSLRLAQAIVAAAERLVNELSSRARQDATRQAEADVATAETRLRAALTQIREFRDREGMIDPGKSAEATAGLATRLRDELAQANAQLSTLAAYMRDDAPPIKVLKARIRSLEAQRRAAAQELTTNDRAADRGRSTALSRALSSYEQLDAERRFAETAYQHALSALDRARAEAARQQLYIASFVPPSLPEEALYPRRWRSTGIVALVAFSLWAIGGLLTQSIRDHF